MDNDRKHRLLEDTQRFDGSGYGRVTYGQPPAVLTHEGMPGVLVATHLGYDKQGYAGVYRQAVTQGTDAGGYARVTCGQTPRVWRTSAGCRTTL